MSLGEIAMVRVDGSTLAVSKLDWNADGSIVGPSYASDAGFNGAGRYHCRPGLNDWTALDLRHVGSRRNPLGYSLTSTPVDDFGSGIDLGSGLDLGSGIWTLVPASTSARGWTWVPDSISAQDWIWWRTRPGNRGSLGNAPNSLTADVVGFNIDLKWTPPNVGMFRVSGLARHMPEWREERSGMHAFAIDFSVQIGSLGRRRIFPATADIISAMRPRRTTCSICTWSLQPLTAPKAGRRT